MPMTPPQVRVPTTGPMPRALIAALTMSPSDPENSFAAAGRGDGELDRFARRADQERAGARDRVDRPAADRDDRVTGADRDAGCGERGAGVGVGGLGRQDAVDAPLGRPLGAVLVAGD